MALTAAEKQRRYREKRKLNPEKEAEAKRKDLEKYHKNKRLIKDMTPCEHRLSKKKWRVANAKRKDRQRALRIVMNTPESTPGAETPPPPPDRNTPGFSPRFATPRRLSTPQPSTPRYSSASPKISAKARGRKKIKRDRSKLFRENLKVKKELDKINKKYEKYKKRYNRVLRKNQESRARDDRYNALSNAIQQRYKKVKSLKERRIILNIFNEDNITQSRKKVQIIKDCLNTNQGYFRKHIPKKGKNVLQAKLYEFFNRDDASRATAGKKETLTYKKSKMQKRYLLDSMKNLFHSFQQENPDQKCCYSNFTANRPFYIKPPSIDGRETCLCRLHINMLYLSTALLKTKLIPTSDLNKIIQEQVCDVQSLPCMSGNCFKCQDSKLKYDTTKDKLLVKYPQWVRKTEIVEKSGKKVKITKNVKENMECKAEDLVQKFEETLKDFKRHVYNIKTQYKNYRECIDKLTEDEIALHIDFSENYSCKLHEEIQSHHFGGSRNQVSLHTGVLYKRSSGSQNIEVESFCSVSSNLSHVPSAIWCHLHPILSSIRERSPNIKVIHIFSDGPATQYRQKQNFYLICTKLFSKYNFDKVTWNFFEAGHGKGAADGVGGFIKRTADQVVAVGKDISDAYSFYQLLKDSSKVKMYLILDEDFENFAREIPTEISPLYGTMKVHQVFTEEMGSLMYRELSCFCQRGFCSCMSPKTYYPLKETIEQSKNSNPAMLEDITNLIVQNRKSIYDAVYSSNSESSDDDMPLSEMRSKTSDQPGLSKEKDDDNTLIEKENIHPSKIKEGVYVLVKMCTSKNEYIYLGKALTEVDDDGEVKIVFLKSVDDTGKAFKLVENDTSFQQYESLIRIVSEPKKVIKGKKVYYHFPTPLEIFEK